MLCIRSTKSEAGRRDNLQMSMFGPWESKEESNTSVKDVPTT